MYLEDSSEYDGWPLPPVQVPHFSNMFFGYTGVLNFCKPMGRLVLSYDVVSVIDSREFCANPSVFVIFNLADETIYDSAVCIEFNIQENMDGIQDLYSILIGKRYVDSKY